MFEGGGGIAGLNADCVVVGCITELDEPIMPNGEGAIGWERGIDVILGVEDVDSDDCVR